MNRQLTLIFDIGKTNKKYFLFGKDASIIESASFVFKETTDEDGFLCDDIHHITHWCLEVYRRLIEKYNNQIKWLNFSTYGASFVHLDNNGEVVPPIYNYLKPIPGEDIEDIYHSYGGKTEFCRATGSPPLLMLNSGMQLLWLKNQKPEKYKKIKVSLHFPNYLSYLFTSEILSEYTSIGCHTALWNFDLHRYHQWVYDQNIDHLLAPIVRGDLTIRNKDGIMVGTGLHDSSAALIPYLHLMDEEFLLLSTGTWSITLNPFNDIPLTEDQLAADCLTFLKIDGRPVVASRLFLGNEFAYQLKKLNKHFEKDENYFKNIKFDEILFQQCQIRDYPGFDLFQERRDDFSSDLYSTFEEAYHQLVYELVQYQIRAISLTLPDSHSIKSIIIDGGFAQNEIFCAMLKKKLPGFSFSISNIQSGAAMGAAVTVSPSMRKHLIKNRSILK